MEDLQKVTVFLKNGSTIEVDNVVTLGLRGDRPQLNPMHVIDPGVITNSSLNIVCEDGSRYDFNFNEVLYYKTEIKAGEEK